MSSHAQHRSEYRPVPPASSVAWIAARRRRQQMNARVGPTADRPEGWAEIGFVLHEPFGQRPGRRARVWALRRRLSQRALYRPSRRPNPRGGQCFGRNWVRFAHFTSGPTCSNTCGHTAAPLDLHSLVKEPRTVPPSVQILPPPHPPVGGEIGPTNWAMPGATVLYSRPCRASEDTAFPVGEIM